MYLSGTRGGGGSIGGKLGWESNPAIDRPGTQGELLGWGVKREGRITWGTYHRPKGRQRECKGKGDKTFYVS